MTTAVERTTAQGHHLAGTRWRAYVDTVLAVLGSLSLLGIVGLSVLIVLATAERRSVLSPTSRHGLPAWMAGPLGGLLPGLTHHNHVLLIRFSLAVAAMFVLYLIVLLTVHRLSTWAVLGAIAAVHVAFFLSPPLMLTDIFNYLNYARMGVVHGLNPYVHVPAAVGGDQVYRLTTWHHLRSPYGPLFTLGSYPLALLPLSLSYWIFKGAVMLASVGVLAFVWKCAGLLGRSPRAAVAFVGLNPLFVVYGLGGQHNDVFMMLLVLAGVYLILRSRELVGGAAFAAAIAIKASAGVLLPIVILGTKRSWRAAAGAAAAFAVLALLTLAAFGPHLPNDVSQSQLVVPFGLTNEIGLALGLGGVTASLRHALELLLGAAVLVACVVAWRGRRLPSKTLDSRGWLVAAAAVSLVVVLTLTWVMPWYLYWTLPLAALVRSRALRIATVVVGISLLFTWLPLAIDFNHKVLHVYPTRTAVGKKNSAYVHQRLR